MDPKAAADVVMLILISLFFVGMFAPAITHRMKARRNAKRAVEAPVELEEHRQEDQPKDERVKRPRLAA